MRVSLSMLYVALCSCFCSQNTGREGYEILSVRFAQCQILWLLDSLDFLMRLGRLVEFEAMLSTSVTSSSSETPSSRNLPLMALVLENSRIVNFNRMQDRLECACNTHDFYLMYIKPR
jgi:hypothetical protein